MSSEPVIGGRQPVPEGPEEYDRCGRGKVCRTREGWRSDDHDHRTIRSPSLPALRERRRVERRSAVSPQPRPGATVSAPGTGQVAAAMASAEVGPAVGRVAGPVPAWWG